MFKVLIKAHTSPEQTSKGPAAAEERDSVGQGTILSFLGTLKWGAEWRRGSVCSVRAWGCARGPQTGRGCYARAERAEARVYPAVSPHAGAELNSRPGAGGRLPCIDLTLWRGCKVPAHVTGSTELSYQRSRLGA